jgi:hypothetical protein
MIVSFLRIESSPKVVYRSENSTRTGMVWEGPKGQLTSFRYFCLEGIRRAGV